MGSGGGVGYLGRGGEEVSGGGREGVWGVTSFGVGTGAYLGRNGAASSGGLEGRFPGHLQRIHRV
jgi:hypothetical protein